MIVGSIYLGKKARKAYRKHQAEKAAKQLTNPIDIVDPSDELKIHAPPASPTQGPLSASSTYSEERSVAGLSSTTSHGQPTSESGSSYSALGNPYSATASHTSEEFARFNARSSNRLLQEPGEMPPSYDLAVSSAPTCYTPVTSYSHSGRVLPLPAPAPQCCQHGHNGYPAYMATMHHHQYYQSHFHHHHPHVSPLSHSAPNTAAARRPPIPSNVAELPDQHTLRGGDMPPSSRPMSELPDTSKIAEMPAELPSGMQELAIGSTSSTPSIETREASVELPSDTTPSVESREKLEDDIKGDRLGEWKAEDRLPTKVGSLRVA